MKITREDGKLTIYTNAGPIHRPSLYIMHKSMGWQWQRLHKTKTGHWTFALGRIVFTTM